MDRWSMALNPEQEAIVHAAQRHARWLYEGRDTGHHSCGIAIASTAGVPTPPYQSLRKGGLFGAGPCGAVMAGRLVLGELLGDPDPTGSVTPRLREAMQFYDGQLAGRIDRKGVDSWMCADLTAPHGDFTGPTRALFCTAIAGDVAALVIETLLRAGVSIALDEWGVPLVARTMD